MRTKRIYISFYKAAKWDGYGGIEPKFGYNWFYWLPHLSWNGGLTWKKQCCDIGVAWLIFGGNITIYSKSFITSDCEQAVNSLTPLIEK